MTTMTPEKTPVRPLSVQDWDVLIGDFQDAGVAGHLWSLCQAERTHAVQAYLILFTTVFYNVVNQKLRVSLLSTSVPLVPFNAPNQSSITGQGQSQGLGTDQKELRRTLAFMLESPYLFTSYAMMEFMEMLMII